MALNVQFKNGDTLIAKSNTKHKIAKELIPLIINTATAVFVSCSRKNNDKEIADAKDYLRKMATQLKFEESEPREIPLTKDTKFPAQISFVCNKVKMVKQNDNSAELLDMISGAF